MRWQNNRLHQTWANGTELYADNLLDDEKEIVATVVLPGPRDSNIFGYYRYQCRQPGCGDNLASQDSRYIKRVARQHQQEAHPALSFDGLRPLLP